MSLETREVDVKDDPFGSELEVLLKKYGKTAYIVIGVDDAGIGFSMAQGTSTSIVTLLYTFMIEYPWAFAGLYEAVLKMSIDVATTEAAMEAIINSRGSTVPKKAGGKSPPAVMGQAKF